MKNYINNAVYNLVNRLLIKENNKFYNNFYEYIIASGFK
jgi:hypothetical protein